MNKIVSLMLISLVSIGCAGESENQKAMSALEAREAAMSKEIQDLQSELTQKKEATKEAKNITLGDAVDASSDYGNRAWSWLSEEAREVYQSDTSKEARERFNRCIETLKDGKKENRQ